MNREIKFRAWDKLEDRWAIINEIMNYIKISASPDIPSVLTIEGGGIYELQMHTGLKDKNGTEIYEGDIVENDGDDAHEVVTFDEGSFWLDGSTYTTPLYEVNTEAEEVIGNIHEHPHLLGGVDE